MVSSVSFLGALGIFLLENIVPGALFLARRVSCVWQQALAQGTCVWEMPVCLLFLAFCNDYSMEGFLFSFGNITEV